MKPTKQVRLKRTSQIWRPSEIPADAGPQIWFSRTYLEMNMRPELCRPSKEARRTTSFKKYLPNLTAFRNSSRLWITDLVFKDFARNQHAAQTMSALVRSPTSNSVENVSPNSGGIQKIQPMLDRRLGFQGFVWKSLCCPNHLSLRMKPTKQVRLKRTSQIWQPSEIPADAGPQIWLSRIYLEMNMRPELCLPS